MRKRSRWVPHAVREAWLCDVYKRFGDVWHSQTTGKPVEGRVPHTPGCACKVRAKVACELHNEGGLPTCNSFGVFDRLQTPSKDLKAPSFLPTPPFPPFPFPNLSDRLLYPNFLDETSGIVHVRKRSRNQAALSHEHEGL